MANLCIIPARGGSKRIPRKNIKDFLSKPIIAYSIEIALTSGLFDEVMVSTDDYEIAAIAENYGANVPFLRSPEKANDFATTTDVLNEVHNEYQKIGKQFELICCIYPCAPFIQKEWLSAAHQRLIQFDHTSVFPVFRSPVVTQRCLTISKEGTTFFREPKFAQMRSQDIEPTYFDAGQFYWLKSDILSKNIALINSFSGSIIVEEDQIQDIDTLEDWLDAETKFKKLGLDE